MENCINDDDDDNSYISVTYGGIFKYLQPRVTVPFNREEITGQQDVFHVGNIWSPDEDYYAHCIFPDRHKTDIAHSCYGRAVPDEVTIHSANHELLFSVTRHRARHCCTPVFFNYQGDVYVLINTDYQEVTLFNMAGKPQGHHELEHVEFITNIVQLTETKFQVNGWLWHPAETTEDIDITDMLSKCRN